MTWGVPARRAPSFPECLTKGRSLKRASELPWAMATLARLAFALLLLAGLAGLVAGWLLRLGLRGGRDGLRDPLKTVELQ